MKTKRNTSSGKRTTIAPSGIVLFIMILFLILGGQKSFAQGVGISEVSISPDASSILELRSTLRGLLAPRMTTAERSAIPTPATGLLIYNTTTNAFNYYNGTGWIAILNIGTGVTSVSGTLNRISIGGTPTVPVIDIDASYIGQTSITTLGTINTGTWNGTAIGIGYGGTGQTTQQSAINVLAGAVTSGQYLRGNGTNVLMSGIQTSDVPTLNQNTTGSAARWTTARSLAGNSVDGTANVPFANKFIVQGTVDAGLSGAQFLGALSTGLVRNTTTTGVLSIATSGTDYSAGTSALATGILRSTTATGALSIAVAGDFPTLNQNTTGTAANVTGTVAIANGGTGQITAQSAINSLVGSVTSGQYLRGNGTNVVMSGIQTADVPTLNQSTTGTANIAGGTLGAIPYQTAVNTTGVLASTVTANKVLMSGSSAAPVWSTPTFPNVSATIRKIIVSDGVNWTASTETYAVPGAIGNLLVSDGTNWTSAIPTFNQNTTGSAARWTTARSLAGNSVDGTANVPFANKFIVQGTVDAGLSGAQFLGALSTGLVRNTTTTGVLSIATSGTDYSAGTSALATGILRSTTATGALSIAVAGDFPTLNQNTTGTAANVTGTVAIANGGTGQITAQSAINSLVGSVTSGQYLRGNGTNVVMSGIQTADVPTLNQSTTGTANIAGGTLGAIPYQTAVNTTGVLASTVTANKVLMSGSSAAPVWSTPTFPNVSATIRKIIVSDGVNWTASTETYAVPGAIGNLLVSDGTNWTSAIPTFNQNTTGSAARWTTARSLAGNSVDGTANVPFANKFIVQGTVDAGLSGAQFLGALSTGLVRNTTTTGVLSIATSGTDYSAGTSALATGILRSTTATGALSIAVAGDFPTLNQNTTGTAANVTGTVAVANGGTGLTTFGGANTVLYTTAANALNSVAASTAAGQFLQTTAIGGVPSWKTTLAVANGGTGLTTFGGANTVLYTTAASALNSVAASTAAGQFLQTNSSGGVPSWKTTLAVINGGTNSSTALSGSSIMVSNGTSIVQGSAGTATTVLHGNVSGVPTFEAVDLATDVTGVLPISNLPNGTMILINASETDISGTTGSTAAVSYVLAANTYSRILVEVNISLEQAGNNDADWAFALKYGSTTKETIPIRARGSSSNHAHDIGAVLKYSEAYASGGTISVDVISTSANGTWYIRGFRVYGII